MRTALIQPKPNLVGNPIAVKAVWHSGGQTHDRHWLATKILSIKHHQI
jgi:hypothetical protein